ncbi:MAG: six-cysteine ranthipeptide SCIFF [Christensenellaceae bacterium]|nr:six-cysteine ranthipeptide SCIFF [Christensenellaceae bacterium]
MKHITNIKPACIRNDASTGCGECQASCQSACKTSCTVANQKCAKSSK